MENDARDFLKSLLETPSPSGYEEPVQQLVRSYVAEFADDVRTDVHGNVIARRASAQPPRLMVAGHCDQIGLLVTSIDDLGFIYAQTIGGWDPQQLVGQRMSIWTEAGEIPAVIARKPIHLLTQDELKRVVEPQDLWLDIGARNKEEAKATVRIGDPITLQLGWQPLRNGLANAPGMDDKVGLWVVCEALRRVCQAGAPCDFVLVSTVQEEIGLRGSRTSTYGIDPHLGIAVDVTHATDCPTIDRRQQGEIFVGKGPVIFRGPNMNPVLVERLIHIAEDCEIPYQLSAIGKASSNDANSIQVSRAGVATAVVAIPNRYMHSAVETISLHDLEQAAELIASFAMTLRPTDSFIPRRNLTG